MVTATTKEENGEFCVTVASVTRNAGILTKSWLLRAGFLTMWVTH